MVDLLPGDRRRRLDLLGDRRARGAGHEEQQHGLGAGHGALRQQHAARPLLGVGVRDVEAEAAGAGGADLDVDLGPGRPHPFVEHLDVADQPRHVDRLEEVLHRLAVDVAVARHQLPVDARRLVVDVLVGDAGRGVDAVDHHLGLRPGELVVEHEGGEVLLAELAELCVDVVQPGGALQAGEDVALGRGDLGVGPLGRELAPGLFGLVQPQGVDLELPGSTVEDLPADGEADEAGAAQDEDFSIFDIHTGPPNGVGTWNRIRGGCRRPRRERARTSRAGAGRMIIPFQRVPWGAPPGRPVRGKVAGPVLRIARRAGESARRSRADS